MKTLLRLCAGALLLASCSIYHPQIVDIPLINHQGDTRVDVAAGMSWWILPECVSFGATASYGFTDWLAGQAHVAYGGDNFYLQAAPGVYKPLGEKSVAELYAGIGYGGAWNDKAESTSDSPSSNDFFYSGTFLVPFVQGNIGWHDLSFAHIDFASCERVFRPDLVGKPVIVLSNNDGCAVARSNEAKALGIKMGAYMPNFDYHELDANGDRVAGSGYTYSTTNFLFEPQAMLRFGGEHLKFNVRLGYVWLSDVYDSQSSSRNFYYDLFTTSAGLTFYF